MIPAYFNWSGGKDSCLALYHVLKSGELSIRQLVTTKNEAVQRVSMHGVRSDLMEQQARSIGIPLHWISLPDTPTMSSYEDALQKGMQPILASGIQDCVFGDIFLEDLREYREEKLAEWNVTPHFPLWKRNTSETIREFIALGFKTIVVCVDSNKLSEEFVGRTIDEAFINELPKNVDPCGENGEFHTFVYDGPLFQQPVSFELGEKVFKEYSQSSDADDSCGSGEKKSWGFWYVDLI